MARWSDLYARHRADGSFEYLHPCREAVEMGCAPEEVVAVRVIEDPDGPWWGWWCSVEACHELVFPTRALLEMCFPYGSKVASAYGEGDVVRLRVEPREP